MSELLSDIEQKNGHLSLSHLYDANECTWYNIILYRGPSDYLIEVRMTQETATKIAKSCLETGEWDSALIVETNRRGISFFKVGEANERNEANQLD